MKKYFKLLRVKHYIKNILIFLPIFFSKNLMNKTQLLISTLGFILFSIVCSMLFLFSVCINIFLNHLNILYFTLFINSLFLLYYLF